MKSRLTLLSLSLSLSLLAACGTLEPSPAAPALAPGESAAPSQAPSDIGQAVIRAAQQFAVPQPLLAAVAYAQTRLYFVPGEEGEASGGEATYGVMALRGERLQLGAQLAGVSVESAQQEVLANILAGAALLRHYADEAKIGGI